MMKRIVISDPDILSGTPCFAGTRVPVQVLFENLADDWTLSELAREYPSVPRERMVETLKCALRLIEYSTGRPSKEQVTLARDISNALVGKWPDIIETVFLREECGEEKLVVILPGGTKTDLALRLAMADTAFDTAIESDATGFMKVVPVSENEKDAEFARKNGFRIWPEHR